MTAKRTRPHERPKTVTLPDGRKVRTTVSAEAKARYAVSLRLNAMMTFSEIAASRLPCEEHRLGKARPDCELCQAGPARMYGSASTAAAAVDRQLALDRAADQRSTEQLRNEQVASLEALIPRLRADATFGDRAPAVRAAAAGRLNDIIMSVAKLTGTLAPQGIRMEDGALADEIRARLEAVGERAQARSKGTHRKAKGKD